MIDVDNMELEEREVEVRYVEEKHPFRNFLINVILFVIAFYISMPILLVLLNSCVPVK